MGAGSSRIAKDVKRQVTFLARMSEILGAEWISIVPVRVGPAVGLQVLDLLRPELDDVLVVGRK
jgi:hypothetical protein